MKTIAPIFAVPILTLSLFGEEPKKVQIIASPETTYFVSPQLPDGRIDYRTILNNICSEGVTPDENVLVAMFTWLAGEREIGLVRWAAEKKHGVNTADEESMVKSLEHTNQYREKVWRELGFTSSSGAAPDWKTLQYGLFPYDDPVRNVHQELQRCYSPEELAALLEPKKKEYRESEQQRLEQQQISQEQYNALMKEIDKTCCNEIINKQWNTAMNSLWTEKEFPFLADGIKKTDKDTQKLLECSRRTQYFHPYFVEDEKQSDVLAYTLLPYAQPMRSAARFLKFRGNWDFANGNVDQAFDCAFAAVRLGNTIRKGGFFVEELIGIAICVSGDQQLILYLAHIDGKKNADWILQKKKEFEACPQVSLDHSQRLVLGERLTTLSIVQELIVHWEDVIDLFEGLEGGEYDQTRERYAEMFGPDKVYDWNVILRRCNLFYDDYEDITTIPDPVRRLRVLNRLEKRIKEEYEARYETEQDGTRRAGDLILATFTPAMVAVELARYRAEWTHQTTGVAFALAAYRSDHGGMNPETLAQLVPKYMESVPTSPYTGEPLIYVNRKDACFIASTDTYKFDGSDPEVERVISETLCGLTGTIHPEAYSRHHILMQQK
ncbi:MAG: hypothetical protein LBI05_05330 [Planctomycetaceae bacterium]|jgi:hypothetical protein|nr:hypothetical protein [Planctomycetaceae bacterium]